jgi:hypothetical protein
VPRGHLLGLHTGAAQTARFRRTALLIAPLATVLAVGIGVLANGAAPIHQPHPAALTANIGDGGLLLDRDRHDTTRGGLDRLQSPALMADPRPPKVTGHRWTTAPLNVWTAPTEASARTGLIRAGHRIGVTGRNYGGFAQVLLGGEARWVHAAYLAVHKPVAPTPSPAARTSTATTTAPPAPGLVFQPCAATASVENGLVPDAIRAWEAVCNAFPQITTYGGLANRPEHDTGHAVDAMTSDPSVGYAIASFLQAHATELNLYDIIYRQHIWTPVRASEGWRLMPDRGSPTANHMDHVHFAVN